MLDGEKFPELKILSIDGGGIKGIIPCMILDKIEKLTGQRISELFDVIAGTSTGGLLALGLSVGKDQKPKYSAEDLIDLYQSKGNIIFPIKPYKTIRSFFRPTFQVDGLERLLVDYFDNIELKDALTNVLITSYDIKERKPFYFISRLAKEDDQLENFLVRDIARATSAAPTYFKPQDIEKMGSDTGLIDGGVFANNPAVLAYTEAREIYVRSNEEDILEESEFEQHHATPAKIGITGRDPNPKNDPSASPFYMLSLGTGNHMKPYTYTQTEKWGQFKWIQPLINILMQGVSESVHYQMQYILPPISKSKTRYVRINPDIPDNATDMSDVSAENIGRLMKAASAYISKNEDLLDQICKVLTK